MRTLAHARTVGQSGSAYGVQMALRATEGLAPERYEREAGEALSQIVARVDPSHEFFTDAAAARAILFPASYALDEGQFEALRQAAAMVGDTDGFYLHSVERHAPRPDEPHDWPSRAGRSREARRR